MVIKGFYVTLKITETMLLMVRPMKGSKVSVQISDKPTVTPTFALEEHVYHVGMLWK